MGRGAIEMQLFSFLNITARSARQRDCSSRLHETVQDLAELTSGTEGEFLAFGEKLRDFYSRTKEVSNLSASITEKMIGAEVTEAMEGLQEIFDRIGRLDGQSGRGRDALTSILERFAGVRRHLQGFEKTVRNLHILCNFIKIESARSGRKDTGFETLADDVRKLAERIESQSALLLEQSAALMTVIDQNLEKIRTFEDRQHQQAGRILHDAVADLNAMREKHLRSTNALKTLSLRWEELNRNIGKVVSSVQFHDITRQRIEHVREALSELIEELQASDGQKNGKRGKSIAGVCTGRIAHVADTCELQAAQLRHARDEMVSAVVTLIENTRDIVRNVKEMTNETGQLLGVSGMEGHSFFADLEGGLVSLISAVSDYVKVNRELSAALFKVTETVEEMSSFVSEIEKIGFRMKMVALNASVHAAHIGEEGLGLGVLADALHPLSVETSSQIGAIAGALNTIIASSRQLSEGLSGDAADPKEDIERTAEHLQATMAPLHSLDESNLAMLARIDEIVRDLSEDIDRTTTAIHVHERIDQEVGRVDAELTEIVTEMCAALPERNAGRERGSMEALSARYTMDKEREIHESITSGTAPAARGEEGNRDPSGKTSAGQVKAIGSRAAESEQMTTGPTGPEKAGQEELGDNVELF